MTISRGRAALAAIILTALGLRVFTALRHPGPEGDGIAAGILLADNINRGHGFTTYLKWTLHDPDTGSVLLPEANRQPAFPYILSLVFRFTGPGMRPAQGLSILAGILCLLSVYRWARGAFGNTAALGTAAFLAVNPPFIWFSTQPDSLLLYTALVFATMSAAGSGGVTWKRAVMLGVLSGATYLCRTQGILLAFSMGLWILIRGGRGRFSGVLLFGAAFLIVTMPWWVRNIREFGNPTHSQNTQFLLNENHWSAWSVRSTPPDPLDLWRYGGVRAVAGSWARGVLRVTEPFTLGSTHRGEPFGQPTLAVFLLFALLYLKDNESRRRALLPALIAFPLMAALTLHQHSGRYLVPVYAMVAAFGTAGILRLRERVRGLSSAAVVVTGLILLRPLLIALGSDNRERTAEAMESARWIRDNTPDSSRVVTYPNVELYHWVYRRPTVTWPNDYEMLLWPCLEQLGTEYLVVDPDLPRLRPWLSRRWRRSPDGASWDVAAPPEFLEELWRSSSGKTIIYGFTGSVPPGFMQVDSVPRDNLRALAPLGL